MNLSNTKKLKLKALSVGLMTILSTSVAWSSSHREAPYITNFPKLDGTDFYVFNSYEPGKEDYVTLLANYQPVQAAYGGPNYFTLDSNALYEIHIDNDGDAVEDISFQFTFFNEVPESGVLSLPIGSGENQKEVSAVLRNVGGISTDGAPGLNYVESYVVRQAVNGRNSGQGGFLSNTDDGTERFGKPFDYSGTKTFGGQGNYETYANSFIHEVNIPGCNQTGQVFVGQRLEGFKIALGEIFDLVNFVPVEGDSSPGAGDGDGFPGGITQDPDRNVLDKSNVTTLALEIPKACLTGDGNGVIGAWTTSSMKRVKVVNPQPTLDNQEFGVGSFTQVSRLGQVLVNELFIGFDDKDLFNASAPKDDGQFADYVTHPVFPAIVNLLFKDAVNSTLGTNIADLAPTNIPRTDLVTGFLTGFPGVNQLSQVTPSEMVRLNTGIPATPKASQSNLGVAAGDLAGFPNGRRPGDDTVDIALRVAMGALCHDLPLGANGAGVNLGLCTPADAPIGNVPLTDGAPVSAADFNSSFPYLLRPYAGSPNNAAIPTPSN